MATKKTYCIESYCGGRWYPIQGSIGGNYRDLQRIAKRMCSPPPGRYRVAEYYERDLEIDTVDNYTTA